MLRRGLQIFAILLLLGAGVVAYLGLLSPVARQGFRNIDASERIKKRSLTGEVLRVMGGPPAQEYNLGRDGKLWVYSAPPIYIKPQIAIRFDAQDRVVYVLPPE